MDKLQEIREALGKATPGPWAEVDAVGTIYGGDGTVVLEYGADEEQGNIELIANAPSYITYLLETVEQLQKRYDRLVDAELRYVQDIEQLQQQQQNTTMKDALEKAEQFISSMTDYCGKGLMVHNWHQNGDGEPWDNFFDDNGAVETMEVIQGTLSTIEGGKASE